MIHFFGERWDAPALDDPEAAVQMPTPVGGACVQCSEPIVEGDRGFYRAAAFGPAGQSAVVFVHAECELLGIVGHEFGICSCTGFDTSSREAARELWRTVGEARGRDLTERKIQERWWRE